MILKYIMICDRMRRRISLSRKKQKEKWFFWFFLGFCKVYERPGGVKCNNPAPDTEGLFLPTYLVEMPYL
jgi:hypothetical protein